eukprot:CAMPEP_0172322400 /NCGR_PEP_ID=MMETSP1058-20130122/45765_1 /TAXON_ID=83371 /ORGANISM="Detonula confervacea, Strain CCMP 353" /LENGTH=156 /DNA_ID=CAMNT_0013038133 /DNA_START=368 /DNA_END=838 /DNA_ORIENTATION=+
MNNLAYFHAKGECGLTKDSGKALSLWLRSGKLGCAEAYYNVATEYYTGQVPGGNMLNTKHYWELAAMGGDTMARDNLGIFERNVGNIDRAVKHFTIAAGDGYETSLKPMRDFFKNGLVTKDDFEKVLRAHKESIDEIRSDQRDKAAASCDRFRYIK